MAEAIPPKPPDKNILINNNPNTSTNIRKEYEINLYNSTDKGPFEIYIQSKTKNIGNYHMLGIAKEIFNLKLKEINKINKKGKNRIGVIFNDYKSANEFILKKKMEEKGYESYIPAHFTTCKGIVKQIDKQLTEEELKENSTTALANCKVINARRMNRRSIENNQVTYPPTGTILYTFSGKDLPREVYIYGLPIQVIPYISPVIFCQNCLLYGHSKNQCKGTTKCSECGKKDCNKTECSKYCIHCSSCNHNSNNRYCQEYIRQKDIKNLMSFYNLSFFEANAQIPKSKNLNNDYLESNRHKINNYPNLKKSTPSLDIPVEQRRTVTIKENPNMTYSSIAQRNLNKNNHNKQQENSVRDQNHIKRKRQTTQSYNKEEINNILINPNGRIHESPRVREEVKQQTEQDIQYMISLLPQEGKDSLITYLSNAIKNFKIIKETSQYKENKDTIEDEATGSGETDSMWWEDNQ